jgi:hypothetical protein
MTSGVIVRLRKSAPSLGRARPQTRLSSHRRNDQVRPMQGHHAVRSTIERSLRSYAGAAASGGSTFDGSDSPRAAGSCPCSSTAARASSKRCPSGATSPHSKQRSKALDAVIKRRLPLAAGQHKIGSEAAVEHLIEVLFVQVIRSWLDTSADSTPPSWFTGLRDAGHRTSARTPPRPPRTRVDSRRARRRARVGLRAPFNDLFGEPPAAYLTCWRMELAVRLLRESEQPVSRISHLVGYTSEFAFSKHRGEPPGRYRKRIKSSLAA